MGQIGRKGLAILVGCSPTKLTADPGPLDPGWAPLEHPGFVVGPVGVEEVGGTQGAEEGHPGGQIVLIRTKSDRNIDRVGGKGVI